MPVMNFLLCLMAAAPLPYSESEGMCGTYSLYVGLNSLDAELPGLDALEKTLGPPPSNGHSLAELAEAAQKMGFQTLGVHTTLEDLAARPGRFVCIAHLQRGHFAIIRSIHEDGVHVIDPPGSTLVMKNVWNAAWDGDSLLISREPLLPEVEIEALATEMSQAIGVRRTTYRWGLVLAAISVLGAITWGLVRKSRSPST